MGGAGTPEGPDRSDLDAAMRAAWKRTEGSSVLRAIEARGGAVPRVLLRGFAEEDPPW